MKKIVTLFWLILVASIYTFAQNAAVIPAPVLPVIPPLDPIMVPPDWLQSAILLIKNIPAVGPILVKIGQYAGVLATVLTSLSVAVIGILKSLQVVLNIAKAPELAAKIEAFEKGKILYWLKYLSMLNAEKKV